MRKNENLVKLTSWREVVEDVRELQGTVTDADGGSEMVMVRHVRRNLGRLRLLSRVTSHHLRPSLSRQRSQRCTAR